MRPEALLAHTGSLTDDSVPLTWAAQPEEKAAIFPALLVALAVRIPSLSWEGRHVSA